VIITHDREIAGRLSRRIEVLDGQIVLDSAERTGRSVPPVQGVPGHG
jgi:ABC-type lipoprotein export system ATPase subunit